MAFIVTIRNTKNDEKLCVSEVYCIGEWAEIILNVDNEDFVFMIIILRSHQSSVSVVISVSDDNHGPTALSVMASVPRDVLHKKYKK